MPIADWYECGCGHCIHSWTNCDGRHPDRPAAWRAHHWWGVDRGVQLRCPTTPAPLLGPSWRPAAERVHVDRRGAPVQQAQGRSRAATVSLHPTAEAEPGAGRTVAFALVLTCPRPPLATPFCDRCVDGSTTPSSAGGARRGRRNARLGRRGQEPAPDPALASTFPSPAGAALVPADDRWVAGQLMKISHHRHRLPLQRASPGRRRHAPARASEMRRQLLDRLARRCHATGAARPQGARLAWTRGGAAAAGRLPDHRVRRRSSAGRGCHRACGGALSSSSTSAVTTA